MQTVLFDLRHDCLCRQDLFWAFPHCSRSHEENARIAKNARVNRVFDFFIFCYSYISSKSSILRRLPKWVVQPVAQSVKSIVPAFCKSSLPKEVLVVDRILTYMSVAFSIFPW